MITPDAQRMLIEDALCDAVRAFHMDALSSAVGLRVDVDVALLVLASGLYRHRLGPAQQPGERPLVERLAASADAVRQLRR